MRKLGSTDLLVSPVGLGLAALGRPGYINLGHAEDLQGKRSVAAMESQAHEVLDAAWREGVRYFDVARSYGLAEQFLRSWLQTRKIPASALTVGSKWGYIYTADWQVHAETHEVKQHSLEVLQSQWRESQMNLGQHLHLYQVHSATLESGVLENEAVLMELAKLKSEGGVSIGLTTSGPEQREVLERTIGIIVDGRRLFDSVQVSWNLLERSAAPALQKARAAGMGVIVKEALANGRLTSRNTDPADADKLLPLKSQAVRLGTTVDALALAAVLAQPWADVVLSGVSTVAHLHSNLQALHVRWDQEADDVLATLAEPPEVYWQKRKELAWN